MESSPGLAMMLRASSAWYEQTKLVNEIWKAHAGKTVHHWVSASVSHLVAIQSRYNVGNAFITRTPKSSARQWRIWLHYSAPL